MANLNLHNLASLKAYFKKVAEEHIDVNGYKWGQRKVIQVANRSAATSFLWVQPYEGSRYIDNNSDNIHKAKTAKVAFLKAVASKKFDDEDTDYQACERVIEDIVSRIYRDKRGGLNLTGDWEMIIANIASISTAPIEYTIGSTLYRGWELSVEFQDNTYLAYDEARWLTDRTFDDTFDESFG